VSENMNQFTIYTAGVVFSGLVLAICPAAPRAQKQARGPIIGTISKGHVYVFESRRTPDGTESTPLVKYDLKGKEIATYAIGGVHDPEVPYRWRIAHGSFWGTGVRARRFLQFAQRIPVAEFDLFDARKSSELIRQGINRRYGRQRDCYPHDWELSALQDLATAIGIDDAGDLPHRPGGGNVQTKAVPLPFDLLPVAQNTCLLFMLHQGYMTVDQGMSGEMKDGAVNFSVSYKPVERFRAGFSESFHVYGSDDSYYFLTQSGKLFVADRLAGGLRRAQVVWDDAEQPLVTALTDVDSDKTYLFSGKRDANAFYFALGRGRGTQHFFSASVIQPSDADEPLKTVSECIQVLVAEKKVRAD
jgi:hypothetical protein